MDPMPAIGEALGRYRIETVLGRGGMGAVYRATDEQLERKVALKVLLPSFGEDPTFRARFLRESRVAASIDHPNVIPIYEAGDYEGQLFIAMRYVDGVDLGALLGREGALDPARAVALVGQLAAGLDAAHARGLVHRDVKPSNALVSREGDARHVYLADFGLSKQTVDAATLSAAGGFVGTLLYVAPEVLRTGEAGPRSDLYSLGCVLYECLCGQAPFPGPTETAVIYGHLEKPPPRVSERRPGVPPQLDPVLDRALAKEPGDRFASGAKLMGAARAALGLEPPSVTLAASGGRLALPRPSLRPRLRPALAVAGAAAVVAGAVVLATGGGGNTGVPSESAPLRGAGIVRVDPSDLDVEATVALDGTPTSVTASGDVAWVIDADGQTIAEVSGEKRVRTFATGATPTDLAAGSSGLWIAQGTTSESAGPATRTTSLAHVAPGAPRVAGTVRLPGGGAASGAPGSRVALTRRAVWAIAQDGRVVRVDPTRRRVVRVLDVRAQALAAETERVWILSSDRTLLAVNDAAGTTGVPIDAPAGTGASLAVGGGALWLLDPAQGVVTRVDPGGSGRAHTARVGAGAGPVVFGHGAAWVVDGPQKRVLRLDGRTAAVTGEVRTYGTPRDVAASGRGVWITTGPRTDAAAAAAGCGPVESGGRQPDALLVVDVPLHGAPHRPTDAMAAAVAYVVSRRGYRAGKLQVGYRVCDVSTAQLGEVDLEKCAANARAYASDPRVVIEIGPYNSSCARQQLPVAAAAPRGPLAMISPTNTHPALTREAPHEGPRFYARLVARDDNQAAVMAAELRRRDHRRVFVLDDSAGSPTYGLDVASFFAAAARKERLTVAGRASWAGRDPAAVARQVARARPGAIYLSGVDAGEAGRVIRALRRAVPRATIGVPDLLTPVARLFETAGDGARDALLTASALPLAAMPQRGRNLAAALARDQGADTVHRYVVYAAQAAEAALDAIARSDGSRASVARALLATRLADGFIGPVDFDSNGDLASAPVALFRLARGGGSRTVAATEGAELIAVRR